MTSKTATIRMGEYNELTVSRVVDFGLYLRPEGSERLEVLLPGRYVEPWMVPGAKVRVYVYTDSEDRPVATTEHPFATVGEFAYLQVREVNRVGAFLDWGLSGKELLVPYREQKGEMRRGCQYLVYVYLDSASGRVAATAKVEKYLGNVMPEYHRGAPVKALVTAHDEIGYRVIVDNLHRGMVYADEVFRPLVIGETVEAHVKGVRPDGKIDLIVGDKADARVTAAEERLLQLLAAAPGGVVHLTDRSTPQEVRTALGCSKRDFKRAVGHLYKLRRIRLLPDDGGIESVTQG